MCSLGSVGSRLGSLYTYSREASEGSREPLRTSEGSDASGPRAGQTACGYVALSPRPLIRVRGVPIPPLSRLGGSPVPAVSYVFSSAGGSRAPAGSNSTPRERAEAEQPRPVSVVQEGQGLDVPRRHFAPRTRNHAAPAASFRPLSPRSKHTFGRRCGEPIAGSEATLTPLKTAGGTRPSSTSRRECVVEVGGPTTGRTH